MAIHITAGLLRGAISAVGGVGSIVIDWRRCVCRVGSRRRRSRPRCGPVVVRPETATEQLGILHDQGGEVLACPVMWSARFHLNGTKEWLCVTGLRRRCHLQRERRILWQ
jgi:hypothetical protein